jgi:hypothetical protein
MCGFWRFALELLLPESIVLPAVPCDRVVAGPPACRLSSFPNRTCQMPMAARIEQDVERKSMSIEVYDFALG